MISFPTKPTGAAYDLEFEFLSLLPIGVTVASAVVTATVESGEDLDIDILDGSASASGTVVSVPVHQGVPGVIYRISVLATGSDGKIYPLAGVLAVT